MSHTKPSPAFASSPNSASMPLDGLASAPPSDALELLRREQVSLNKLFFAFHLLCERRDTEREKQAILERLHLELAVHVRVVDEVVLETLPPGDPDADLADEVRSQQLGIEELMGALMRMPGDDAERDAKVEALGEFVERHLSHERNLLFPRLRQAGIDLKALGLAVREHHDQLLEKYQRLLAHHDAPEDESADPVGRPSAG
jgi:hypothetical protein